MSVLEKFEQQPSEALSYEIDATDWLADRGDTAASHTVSVESGLTLQASTLVGGKVRFWVTGGVSGTTYKVTVRITTTTGLVREADVKVKVKEG